jgi:hypothetical protein
MPFQGGLSCLPELLEAQEKPVERFPVASDRLCAGKEKAPDA